MSQKDLTIKDFTVMNQVWRQATRNWLWSETTQRKSRTLFEGTFHIFLLIYFQRDSTLHSLFISVASRWKYIFIYLFI